MHLTSWTYACHYYVLKWMQTLVLVTAKQGCGSGSWKRQKGTASALAIHVERQNLDVEQFF